MEPETVGPGTVEGGGHPRTGSKRVRELPLRDLVTELLKMGKLLALKELELAKAEARQDIRSEIVMASGLGVAGICLLMTIQLLLVAAVLALMEAGVLPGWAAALAVAGAVLAVGAVVGLWGWAKRVRQPLDATRKSVREGVRWAKEQVA